VHYLNLVVDPLNQELMHNRRNTVVCVNPIVAKNNAIVTLHLNDKNVVASDLLPIVSSM
jgi:hypothetical protein